MESPNQWPDNLVLIARCQADFAKRWEPERKYERHQFHDELLYLIHLVYREAQAPVLKQIADIVHLMPITFPIRAGAKPPGVK